MSPHYTTEQEKLWKKLEVVKSMVTDQDLRGTPCALMLSQLYELKVLTSKLEGLTRQMIDATKERIGS